MSKFIKDHYKVISITSVILIGIIIRLLLFNNESIDYLKFLSKWCDYINDNNGLYALKSLKSDYNIPYLIFLTLINYIPVSNLYLIKILSCIFDILLAKLAYDYIKYFTNDEKKSIIGFIIIMLLPTVIINSAYWAQCDSIYTYFALSSLLYLIKKKYHKSFIFLGISFSLKLQFAFILPIYVILYLKEKRFSIKYFLYIPLVNFILCIPSYFVGISPLYTYQTYLFQTGEYINTTAVNIIRLFPFYIPIVNYIFLLISAIIFLLFAIKMYLKKEKLTDNEIISIALLYIMGCYYFLPYMHERYMFMADILCIIWFIINRKYLIIPISIIYCSVAGYLNILTIDYLDINSMIYSLVLPGIILLGISIFKLYKTIEK